jgi:Spy/CpxP family protein refolding chaperone
LTALRAAREKARQELATAQEELRKILTPRQEALLVLMGYLQ